MTVRDLRNVMEDCWFRIESDTLEDENGDCLTLFDECIAALGTGYPYLALPARDPDLLLAARTAVDVEVFPVSCGSARLPSEDPQQRIPDRKILHILRISRLMIS